MTQKPVFSEGLFTLRNLRSVGAAAIIEILIAAGIGGILIWHELRPPVTQPISIDPMPIPDPVQPPVPRHLQVPEPQQPQVQPLTEVPPVRTDIPTPTTQPLQPLLPPSGPAQQPSADAANEFGARVLRAINAQKIYPKVEMMKGDTGETVVSFDYVDGVVSGIHVDKSSGFYELDKAAMDAVQRAVLPEKPAELAGLKHFVFTLAFDLGG